MFKNTILLFLNKLRQFETSRRRSCLVKSSNLLNLTDARLLCVLDPAHDGGHLRRRDWWHQDRSGVSDV